MNHFCDLFKEFPKRFSFSQVSWRCSSNSYRFCAADFNICYMLYMLNLPRTIWI